MIGCWCRTMRTINDTLHDQPNLTTFGNTGNEWPYDFVVLACQVCEAATLEDLM